MRDDLVHVQPERVVVVMPTWLGDCVMATPTLIALRSRFPAAHLCAMAPRGVVDVLDACPLLDETLLWSKREGWFGAARRLRRGRFDLAVLLPGSFRSAWTVRWAGVPRRLGYRRDGRGWLLSDALDPPKEKGRYVPVPTLRYYLRLAEAVGAEVSTPPAMTLWTRPSEAAQAEALLRKAGVKPEDGPLVVLVPGGNKPAKRWPAERFAALADHLVDRCGAQVAVSGSPAEAEVLDRVVRSARVRVADLLRVGVDLRLLKSVFAASSLVVTNDTGPRHVAAAMGAAVVSLFGPTPLAWTVIDCPHEATLIAPDSYDDAGEPRPEGGTMTAIALDDVVAAAEGMLERHAAPPAAASSSTVGSAR